MIYFKNVNSGKILTSKEYFAMVERELLEAWNSDLDFNIEQYETFENFKNAHSVDTDFVECDKDGNKIEY